MLKKVQRVGFNSLWTSCKTHTNYTCTNNFGNIVHENNDLRYFVIDILAVCRGKEEKLDRSHLNTSQYK